LSELRFAGLSVRIRAAGASAMQSRTSVGITGMDASINFSNMKSVRNGILFGVPDALPLTSGTTGLCTLCVLLG